MRLKGGCSAIFVRSASSDDLACTVSVDADEDCATLEGAKAAAEAARVAAMLGFLFDIVGNL